MHDPTAEPPIAERKGEALLGNHLVEHPVTWYLDSQSTATEYDTMPQRAGYDNDSDPIVRPKRRHRNKSSGRQAGEP
jgi:hypothetical protein